MQPVLVGAVELGTDGWIQSITNNLFGGWEKAFLDKNPNPTAEQIKKGLGGNTCRCGTYMGVRAAVAQAAQKGGRRNG